MAEDARISVQVHPRSGREAVRFIADVLHIWVLAPPVEGAANAAVIDLLARRLGVSRRQVIVVRGASARHKQIRIQEMTEAAVRAILPLI